MFNGVCYLPILYRKNYNSKYQINLSINPTKFKNFNVMLDYTKFFNKSINFQ
jgi:hypothetical protein